MDEGMRSEARGGLKDRSELKPDRDTVQRSWEYERRGDYHRHLDPNWSYTPTYLKKMAAVRGFLDGCSPEARILDAACGEGVLVEEYRDRGRDIVGIDLNYESDLVRRGDIRSLPFEDRRFGVVLLLDVLEHLSHTDQAAALGEARRVLEPSGSLLVTVPNLAHLNSRLRLLFKGGLDRADNPVDHLGERPLGEYWLLLRQNGFKVERCTGITFTAPILYRQIICRNPSSFRWLHDLLDPLARTFPSLAFLNLFVCTREEG